MKNFVKFFVILVPLVLVGVFFVTNNASASVNYQTITLSSGWNIISTPKILSSHQFSAPETTANFNIYLLDPTSTSGWQTMQGAGQTEFQPLYAYFINNKTGANQTLQLNYNFNISPAQQLFQRTLQPGWNTIGIASSPPSYALSQGSPSSTDTNNPSNILSSISNAIGQVIDFTNGNTNFDSPAISNTWLSKTVADANSLNDFRELKGYGVFVTSATNNYNGSQNLQVTTGVVPVITLNGASTINLLVGASYTDAGATATDNLDGDITSYIIVVNPVNTSSAGTYTVTYNVSDSSGNNAQQVIRTVDVENSIVLNIVRAGSDQNAHTVTVTNNSGTTQKVPLLQMSIASQGGQAVSLNQIPVVFTPTGHSVYTMTGEVYLMNGNQVLDSEAVPSTGVCNTGTDACTITFKINPSNPLIVSNSPVILTVAADINSITGGGYSAGDSLTVSTPAATASNYDLTLGTPNGSELITASNYAQVIPGTANGQAVAFFATGLNVNVASNTCTAQQSGYNGGPSVMTCTVNFSVSANGAPMYIPQASSSVAANPNTVNFLAQKSGATVVSGTPPTLTVSTTYVQNGTNATNSGSDWTIPAGVTANFTGTVIIDDTTSASPGLYRAFLNDVRYGTAQGTWASDYTFNLGATNPAVPGYAQLN